MRIGYIGLGVMGSRMAARLVQAGYDLLVYNRTAHKMDSVTKLGARAAEDIASLSASVDVVCTCLSMPDDVQQIYEAEDGILAHARPGTICLDFTTVGMDTSVALAQSAKASHIFYLDAPVSGGPEGAEQGTLTIMVGGAQDAFQKVSPILNVVGGNIQYLGASGLGSAAKLLNQYLVAAHSLAMAEVMVAGSALGIRAEQLTDIFKTSYGDSRMLRRHMDEYILKREFEPGGALKYLLKDVRLANQVVEKAGIDATAGRDAQKALETAAAEGLAELDMSAIIQPLERRSGTVVQHSKNSKED